MQQNWNFLAILKRGSCFSRSFDVILEFFYKVVVVTVSHYTFIDMKKFFVAVIVFLSCLFLSISADAQLINNGKADKFLDLEAHLLLGGSYVTQNYKSCYPQITDLNNSMGFAWGIGFGAKFNFSSFIGLGTEFNYLRNAGKMDLAVTSDAATNVSNVFIENKYRTIDIPVFMSFNFNLARNVKWNVDGGVYFDFGTSGTQKATLYNVKVNELGELMMTRTTVKSDYYDDNDAFINSYRNFDMGLHIATGLTFMNKISVGVRSHFGFRNVAHSNGIVKPNAHNIGLFATAGYHF